MRPVAESSRAVKAWPGSHPNADLDQSKPCAARLFASLELLRAPTGVKVELHNPCSVRSTTHNSIASMSVSASRGDSSDENTHVFNCWSQLVLGSDVCPRPDRGQFSAGCNRCWKSGLDRRNN